ncbi:nucleotidyltransferase family protein [Nocardia sp. N13]|uniref:nucleotidyltransferase family protein n=1 Tax=Nocardioides sp. N13(2025) TaxID=3453405 RepID=UPI003F765455
MRVQRGDLQAVHVQDGRASVSRDDKVVVLSEVATAVLESVPEDSVATLEEITTAVLAVVGKPPPPLSALELIRSIVLDLVRHGVLTEESPAPREPAAVTSVSAVRDALRHIVSGSPDGWVPPAAVEGPDFLAAAHRHRVVPILAAAGDRLAFPQLTLDQLATTARLEAEGVADLAAELVEVVEALARAGVRVLVLDGLALAAQAHGDHASRGTGTHALLVSPIELEKAHDVLTSSGWTRSPGFPAPQQETAWRHLVHELHELPLTRASGTIHLHWRLAPASESLPDLDELWPRRATVDVAGHAVATLSPYDALARAAHGSTKDGWGSLRGLLDVWRLLTREDAWSQRDGALSQEQLLSVGLAVLTFGLLPAHRAELLEAVELSEGAWSAAAAAQESERR